jgi:hypothetical protein
MIPHFIEIEGRWINVAQITHIGPIDDLHTYHAGGQEHEARSYIALTSNKTLYCTLPPEAVMTLLIRAEAWQARR